MPFLWCFCSSVFEGIISYFAFFHTDFRGKERLLAVYYYCGKVIFPAFSWTTCCCPRFVCFYFCFKFLFALSFFLLVGSCLNFPFSDVFQSEMWRECFASFPDHLQPLVSRAQETVLALKAEDAIHTYLAGFQPMDPRWYCPKTVFSVF